jgi:hypothetical protein
LFVTEYLVNSFSRQHPLGQNKQSIGIGFLDPPALLLSQKAKLALEQAQQYLSLA